jgi:hypothetical protein
VHGRNDGHGVDAREDELVAVGRRLRHARGAGHAAAAADILDDHLLSKRF